MLRFLKGPQYEGKNGDPKTQHTTGFIMKWPLYNQSFLISVVVINNPSGNIAKKFYPQSFDYNKTKD